MAGEHTNPVQLLWTGGWDSTFQLLRLLLVYRLPVRPIYLVDGKRPSLEVELRTMERIRQQLAEHDPGTRTLMLPTLVARVADLRPDPRISAAYGRLNRQCPIGSQYEWLGWFCQEHGLSEVEVGFEKTRNGAGALLTDFGVPGVAAAGYPVHRLAPNGEHEDIRTVFGFYACPLFDITKQEMAREVDDRGWRPLMDNTWFCHRPRGTVPCGRCAPCVGVIKAGLGWRIPPHRRLIGILHRATIGLAKRTARPLLRRLRDAVPGLV